MDPILKHFGPEIARRIERTVRRAMLEKEEGVEIDPVTLSEGSVVERLGPGTDKWDRPVELVAVRVLKKNAHHKKGDEVIWEIPPESELQRYKTTAQSRADLLRMWVNAPKRK